MKTCPNCGNGLSVKDIWCMKCNGELQITHVNSKGRLLIAHEDSIEALRDAIRGNQGQCPGATADALKRLRDGREILKAQIERGE